jgi:hypothetical protein
LYVGNPQCLRGVLTTIHDVITIQIIKVKKIACRSIPGKGVQTGLRLIYAWQPQKNEIVLLEIYHKNQQTQETMKRISQHLRAGP